MCWNQRGNCRGAFVARVREDYLPVSTAWCGAHCVSHAGSCSCTAPFFLFIFQLVLPCRNRRKRDCSLRIKILHTWYSPEAVWGFVSLYRNNRVKTCVFPSKIKAVRTAKDCIKTWEQPCCILNDLAEDHFQKILSLLSSAFFSANQQ